MPLSKKAIANKKKYDLEYKKTRQKRIPLDVPTAKYEQIKKASETAGETVNGYIKKAINLRLESNK